MSASPNYTVVMAGSGGVIIDASGNKWTISPEFAVLEDGLLVGYTANVAEIAYVNGVIWHENTSDSWYSWNGVNWISGQSPLPTTDAQVLTIVQEIQTSLATLTKKVDAMSVTQTDINTDTTTILADVTAINTAVTAIQAEIAALQAANPTIDTSGLDAAVASLTTATAGVTAVPPTTPPAV